MEKFLSNLQADLRLPAETAAVASARRFTESCLVQWKLSHLTETMNLLVTELVTNAVVHGGTGADLKLLFDSERLRVEVRDGSTAKPRVKNYSTTATTGRGMQIVDALADRWGTTEEAPGKVVWLEFEVKEATGSASSDGAIYTPTPDASESRSVDGVGMMIHAESNFEGGPVGRVLVGTGR